LTDKDKEGGSSDGLEDIQIGYQTGNSIKKLMPKGGVIDEEGEYQFEDVSLKKRFSEEPMVK